MRRVFKGSSRSRWLLGFASFSLLSIAFAPKVLAQVFYHINRGVEVLRDTDNADLEMNALYEVGLRYYRQGRFARALKVFQDSLTAARAFPEGGRDREVIALNRIGWVYESLGQYQQALNSFEEALAIHQSDGTRQTDAGVIYDNIGFAYFRLGDKDKARESFEEALRIHQAWDARADEGRTFGHLGALNLSEDNFADAIELYQRALELHQEVGDRIGEGIALDGLGQAHFKLGDFQEAEAFFDRALEILPQDKTPSYRAIVMSHWGEMLLASGRLAEAETALQNTIEILESLRRDLSDADKVTIFETQTATYELLQIALIGQNQIEAALEISERGRARAFVELMAQRLHDDSADAFVAPAPPTLSEIQQVARTQNSTLVEYSIVANKFLYIWVIQPTGEIAFGQVNLDTLDTPLTELVTASREGIGVRDAAIVEVYPPTQEPSSPAQDLSPQERAARQTRRLQQLHQLLIEPIADLLPSNPESPVIFIPQGELFLVPFPALLDADGTYLLDKHTPLTAPAIQVLQLTRSGGDAQPRRWEDALVVGNPEMPSRAFRPGAGAQQLSNLPGAQQEARAIANLLGTEPLIGSAATETTVRERMDTASIIHLATHGLLDESRGIDSSIALTPDGSEDGFLTAEEILEMSLDAQLVVLSACDTGLGKLTGDGVVGLSRSLVAVGVESVIVSLWKVPDLPTANLMEQFYRNLQQEVDKGKALRNAMLSTRATHPEPINWAAFTLIGNR